jgi:hypothetical protein
MSEQSLEEQQEEEDDDYDFYDSLGYVIDDSMIVQKAMEIMSRYLSGGQNTTEFTKFTKPVSTPKETIRVPEYTFFAEGEDGLMYIKGKFTGHLVTGKAIAHNGPYTVTEAKYADYILKENREGRGNITEDDASVFIKIALGQI